MERENREQKSLCNMNVYELILFLIDWLIDIAKFHLLHSYFKNQPIKRKNELSTCATRWTFYTLIARLSNRMLIKWLLAMDCVIVWLDLDSILCPYWEKKYILRLKLIYKLNIVFMSSQDKRAKMHGKLKHDFLFHEDQITIAQNISIDWMKWTINC